MQERQLEAVRGYELREQIGEGGYGVVYRAYQAQVGRDVAIKIILPQYANHPEFIRRFESEAQLVARLEHPYIVPLYDYWREPDGAFLVMRWLRGGTLHDLLHQEPLPSDQLKRLLDQIGGALAAAHRRGVIHRDLKPANILLDDDGNAYLADFGIAKDLGKKVSPYQTDQTSVIGSPAYISPEQVKAEAITPQTDIYSLGVMLYEILTGRLPFQAPTPIALMFKHINEALPPLTEYRPDLPPEVNAVIRKATAKNPAERYADVSSMIGDLQQALGIAPLTAAWPPHTSGGATPTPSRGRTSYETGIIYLPTVSEPPDARVYDNPYKGLRAFQEADAADFFGRETLVEGLLERLRETGELSRFLAVVGPSGSGKSSVVRAGLIPAIKRGALPNSQNWYVLEMFPNAHPIDELAQALLRIAVDPPNNLVEPLALDEHGLLRVVDRVVPGGDETEVVLLIDQFEELFTLVEDEAARTHFLNSLITAVTDPYSRIRVIVTLRADFYDRPLLYPGFSELMRQRTEVVVPLSAEELKEAIVSPAERAGLRVDPELVGAIVADVGEQPGALPLLQYALTEVFERRQGRVLTLTPYQASGGVLGALARRAEEIYTELEPGAQAIARQLFLRLVTLGEGVEDTRRRVRRSELIPAGSSAQALDAVIGVYSQYRLLTGDRDPITRAPTVEVAHEALIRTWQRLRQWLDASRDDLRSQRRLTAAAAEWASSGRERSFLASGARLEQLKSWSNETHLALNAEEQDYLKASIAADDERQAAEQVRAAREKALEQRSKTFLRALVGGASAAAVVGLLLAIFAFSQRSQALQNANVAATAEANAQAEADNARNQQLLAEQNATEARQQKTLAEQNAAEARNLTLAAEAQAELNAGNTDQAIALALAANSVEPSTLQEQAALASAAYARGTRDVFPNPEGSLESVNFSPDNKTFLTATGDGMIFQWDATTREKIRAFEGHTDKVQRVVFSPDGTKAASGGDDLTVIIWDVASGTLLHQMSGHTDEVKSVAFSPDGTMVLSGSKDRSVRLWDVASGQQIGLLERHPQGVRDVAFSPDGATALSAGDDQYVIWWDIATRAPKSILEGHTGRVYSVVFSPDGTKALSGSTDKSLILWDLATGQPIHVFRGHTRDVFDVALSADGTIAASGSADARIGLWDVVTGQPLGFLAGHGGSVDDVTFSADGRTLLSASSDNSVRRWDLFHGAEQRRLSDPANTTIQEFDFSPDGSKLVYGGEDNTLVMLDVASGKVLYSKTGHADPITSVAFSPDGKRVLSGAGERDKTVLVWDAETGEIVGTLRGGHTKEVGFVAFTPDGTHALTAGGSLGEDAHPNEIILWDLGTQQIERWFAGHKNKVEALAFSPDGKTFATGASDYLVILWDMQSGAMLHTFKGHTNKIQDLAFSPDGTFILSASEDNTLIQWDAASGKQLHTYTGHSAAVNAVALSKDSKTAVSAGGDGLVIVWDVASGQILRRFSGHLGAVRDARFMPGERAVISGGQDKILIEWRLDSADELVAWTKANRHAPELTCDQKRNFKVADAQCGA